MLKISTIYIYISYPKQDKIGENLEGRDMESRENIQEYIIVRHIHKTRCLVNACSWCAFLSLANACNWCMFLYHPANTSTFLYWTQYLIRKWSHLRISRPLYHQGSKTREQPLGNSTELPQENWHWQPHELKSTEYFVA